MSKKEKAGAVAVREETALTFGGNQVPLNAEDIVLRSIAIRQNSYRKEHMKQFKPGDVIIRPDNKVIGKEGEPAVVVPISIEKCYRIVDITGKELKTIGYEPWTSDLPAEEHRGEQLIRRDRAFVAHVLLLDDLASQGEMFERLKVGDVVDPSDFTLPARIVFARSSFHAGKVLNTHFELSKTVNQSPAAISFYLGSIESSNDKGNWYSLNVAKMTDAKKKYTPKEYMDCCNFWVKTMVNASRFKAHEADEETESVESAAASYDVASETRF